MAISTCVAVPRIVPAYSSFSRRNKEYQHYSNNVAALTRSGRVSSPISFPQAKASRVGLEIIRTFSEKDDREVQEELDRLQTAWEKLKGFLGEIVLVLVAINPILRFLSDAMVWNNKFLRLSSFGASYGALVMLNEFVKILWKSQPFWGYNMIAGFLIYKVNVRNIALYRKGHRPFWLEPLYALHLVKFLADGMVPMICSKWMPVNTIWALTEAMTSFCIAIFVILVNDDISKG